MLEKEYNKKPNGTKWSPALIAIVGAIIGSSGSIFVVFNSDVGQSLTRPDPFTGAQASALELRISSVENHVANHPYDPMHDRRLTALEAQYKEIIRNQTRILDRLDGR